MVSFTPTPDEIPPPPPSDDHGDTRDEATVITAGSTTSGVLTSGDNDYFVITVNETGILRAYTTGTTDTRGAIEDSEGNELATNDDGDSDSNFDVSYEILSTGTYYINVDSVSSSTTGAYDLMVSFTPGAHGDTRETATVINAGSTTSGVLTSGDNDYFTITVDDTGILRAYTTGTTDIRGTIEDSDGNILTSNDNGGSGNNFNISYEILSIGTYYINVDSLSSSTTGAYDLVVSFTSDDHGDTLDEATVVTAGSTTSGFLLPSRDDDYFAITVDETGVLRAYTTGTTDTRGTIEDSDGNELATDDNGGSDFNFDVSYEIISTGTYYINVDSFLPSTIGAYDLLVSFTPTPDEIPSPPSDDHGDTLDEATVITAGSTTSGVLTSRDNDYFAITVNESGVLRAYTTGTTDTRGDIEDSEGNELATNDDGGSGLNFDVSHEILSIGTYYINVDGSSSSTSGAYDLVVSFTPGGHGDTRETATVITAGSTTSGVLTSVDNDYFAITVNDVGTILRAYTTGTTNTRGTIEDSEGNILKFNDNSGSGSNFDVSHEILSTGTYYINVNGFFSTIGVYDLVVSFTPGGHGNTRETATVISAGSTTSGFLLPGGVRDDDYFAITVGETGTLRAYTTGTTNTRGTIEDSEGNELATDNNSGSGNNFNMSYEILSIGTYYINVDGSSSSTSGAYDLVVSFTPTNDDHGDTLDEATAVTTGSTTSGVIDRGDDDYFAITVGEAGVLRAYTTGTTDTRGAIEDSDGNVLATNDDGGSDRNFDVSHEILSTGTYYIKVNGFSSSILLAPTVW